MLPQEVIRAKRDGAALADADLASFVEGFTHGAVTEAQVAAFAMAVFFRGLDTRECVALTRAMMRSGTVLSWQDLPGPVLDKHSTGGVGDTVSLMLAPALAACGAYVPMIAGRGLGHTGGTIDKLDSIPGYAAQPGLALFRDTVRAAGCAIIGQTPDLAPADGQLYAIRDVTGTVESIPLITTSILSKKLAAGLHGLVMDVKYGSGAFMRDRRQAGALAASLAIVAGDAGLPTVALLTDMDRPLADTAGNALEMAYAIDYLTGRRREPRMHELVLALGGEALCLGHLAATPAEGEVLIERAIASGAAAERFARMVRLLGGPGDLLERPAAYLASAQVCLAVHPDQPGIVASVDIYALGMAVVALGGGRTRPQDAIDARVGLSALAAPGDDVDGERPLALIHAADRAAAEAVAVRVRAAYRIGARYAAARPVVAARIVGGE